MILMILIIKTYNFNIIFNEINNPTVDLIFYYIDFFIFNDYYNLFICYYNSILYNEI